jgi:DNA topoisomerase VI subunit A
LTLGDYKARLVKDEHWGTYDSLQVYELLFPDRKTRKFMLVGQME